MTFGEVAIAEAEGGILAHSLRQGKLRLRKGRLLSAADIAALNEAGVSHVTVALLAENDVEENVAALRVAQSIAGAGIGIELTEAFTGRVNIIARQPGIARIDEASINALNACDPMITCATVAPLTRMSTGGMLATIKIISYGVPEISLRAAETTSGAQGSVGLFPVTFQTARLIVTETAAGPDNTKGIAAVSARLGALGIALDEVTSVAHDTQDISTAIRKTEEDLCLILTASATSDPADVAPEALRQAGGLVERFGMPVDPGNLLFIGSLGQKPVIGLPGCARSPALNGADWVLERVACGVPVTGADIAAMGVGGLLKEIPQRPQPRRGATK